MQPRIGVACLLFALVHSVACHETPCATAVIDPTGVENFVARGAVPLCTPPPIVPNVSSSTVIDFYPWGEARKAVAVPEFQLACYDGDVCGGVPVRYRPRAVSCNNLGAKENRYNVSYALWRCFFEPTDEYYTIHDVVIGWIGATGPGDPMALRDTFFVLYSVQHDYHGAGSADGLDSISMYFVVPAVACVCVFYFLYAADRYRKSRSRSDNLPVPLIDTDNVDDGISEELSAGTSVFADVETLPREFEGLTVDEKLNAYDEVDL